MLKWLVHRLGLWLSGLRTFDHFYGHPLSAQFVQQARAGQWVAFEAQFDALPMDERHVVVNGLAEVIKDPRCFAQWNSADDAVTSRTIRGAQGVVLAWDVRGATTSRFVPDSAFERFFEMLESAFDELHGAMLGNPSDAEALCWLIPALKGLQANKDQIHDCMDRLYDTGVLHLPAAMAATVALTAKWGGSYPEMFAFARTHAARQPRYAALVPIAHCEHWLAHDDNGEPTRSGYFLKQDVRDEIVAAFRSDPLMEETGYFATMARSIHAFCLIKVGETQLAADLMRAVGNTVSYRPWSYGGGSFEDKVRDARLACGLPER